MTLTVSFHSVAVFTRTRVPLTIPSLSERFRINISTAPVLTTTQLMWWHAGALDAIQYFDANQLVGSSWVKGVC
jgi:hypothetical protein